ncbi:MAG TPA: glycosyltransferase family 39 protein [Vicinamibacterales bacterium]|jgi:hypothetical protein
MTTRFSVPLTARAQPASTLTADTTPPGTREPSASTQLPSWITLLGAGIILVGLLLRIYAAVSFPFEQDELYTLAESQDLFHTTLAPGIDSRPLYYLLQHPLLKVLPHTPFMLRLLPLLFGVLGLWVTWRLGARYFGAIGAVGATLLAAFSPWHLYASSMARYYSLVYLCAALVILLLPDAYASDKPSRYLAVLGAFLVGTFTHPSFVIAMVGTVIGLSLIRSDGRLGWRWPSVKAWQYLWGPYVGALILEVIFLRALGRGSAMANLGSRGFAATLRLVPAMIDWMTVPVFIAAAIGAFTLAAGKKEVRPVGSMTIVASIGTFVLLFVASTRTGVYADYGIGILPMVFLSVAGLSSLRGSGGIAMPAALLAIVIGSGAPSTVSFLSDGLRFDYRPAYAAVAARDPNAVVLGWPEILRKYYAPKLRGFELRPDTAYLDGILQREGTVWPVVSAKRYGIVEDNDGQLASWLSEHCRLVSSFTRPRFDDRIYRVDLHRCQRSF